jgi:hypothetical protein
LQGFLQGLQAAYQLLLLARRQFVADARPGTVEELPRHGPDAALCFAREHPIGQLLETRS